MEIKYHKLVVKHDIQKLNNKDKQIIKLAIENKLSINPLIFGTPLRYSLSGYRKFRIGNYRIIFKIEKSSIIILIIEHRSIIYKEIQKRISK